MPCPKFFSPGESSTAVMDSAPPSLEDQLLKAQAEYESALAKQRALEAEFQQKASVVTSDQFRKLESNLRQQAMVVESRRNALETLGNRLFEERQAEEQKQAFFLSKGNNREGLLHHTECNIAIQRLAGSHHLDRPCGSPSGHRGFDLSIGDNAESCRFAVKGNAGRASQIVSEDRDFPSDLGSAGYGFDEGLKAHGEGENRAAAAARTSTDGGPVKVSVRGLHQPGRAVKRGERI